MIVPILQGGLGNQLFQISTAYALAKENKDEIAINYEISHIGYQKSHVTYKNNFYRNIKEINKNPIDVYREPTFSYKPINYVPNMGILGYFQSEKYFDKYRDDINNLFSFPENIIEKVDNILNEYKNMYKVGIHYRRGDYVKFKNIHPCISKEYYDKAKSYFKNKEVVYLNFSDDFDTVLNEFLIDGKIIKSNNELVDLYMLSRCDSIIMSNSTFAWWGAWLGKRKDVICMPSNWFGPSGYKDFYDIYIKDSIII